MEKLSESDIRTINEIIRPVLQITEYFNLHDKLGDDCLSIFKKQGKNLTESEINTLAYYASQWITEFDRMQCYGPVFKQLRDEYEQLLNKLKS